MYQLHDLDFKNWISRNQFGFLKGRKTLGVIYNPINIEKKQHKLLKLCLFFDIRGASDNAWHPGIVNELKDSGFPIWMVIELYRIIMSFFQKLRNPIHKVEYYRHFYEIVILLTY